MPPRSTPPEEMVTTVPYRGRRLRIADMNAVGPWPTSAYGMVAAVHLRQIDPHDSTRVVDDGVRSHGTHDYTSITTRYSHGCHRLHNHLALRLYDFILRRTPHRYLGRRGAKKVRRFAFDGENYRIEVAADGEVFTLTTPLSVETLPGTIKGSAKQPIARYLRRPDVTYGPNAMANTAPWDN